MYKIWDQYWVPHAKDSGNTPKVLGNHQNIIEEMEEVVITMATKEWRITSLPCGFLSPQQGFIAPKDAITEQDSTFGHKPMCDYS